MRFLITLCFAGTFIRTHISEEIARRKGIDESGAGGKATRSTVAAFWFLVVLYSILPYLWALGRYVACTGEWLTINLDNMLEAVKPYDLVWTLFVLAFVVAIEAVLFGDVRAGIRMQERACFLWRFFLGTVFVFTYVLLQAVNIVVPGWVILIVLSILFSWVSFFSNHYLWEGLYNAFNHLAC